MNRSKKKSFDWYGVRQRFSIRKYHIGAASVLLGTTLVLGTGTIVSAETGVNGDGASNEQIVPVSNDGISDGTQPQGDNQGDNGSGVQTGNTTNSTANVQPAGDTGPASGQPVGSARSADTGTQGDGSTNQPVDESVIKFPTQDNQTPPAGYQSVLFHSSYVKLDFEGKPGEIEITRNGKPIQVVAFWVKTGTTWGTLKKDPQFRIPKYTVDDGDFILGYDRSVGQVIRPTDFDSLDDTPIVDTWEFSPTVDYIVGDVSDGKTFEEYMNSGSYAPYQILQFHGITLNANGGTVDGKAKKAFYVAYKHVQWGDELVTKKIVVPSRDGYTFVRWQTATGEGIPTSGQIETIEFTAVWLKHPTEAVKVFNPEQLSETDKTKVADLIRLVNPDLQNSIQEITVADNGDATVRFTTGEERTISGASLVSDNSAEQRAKAEEAISDAVLQKQDDIAKSQLTAKEQQDKLDKLRELQESIEEQIDGATSEDALDKIVEDGKNSIENFDLTSATKKTAAKQDLETAYNAKKDEIAKSALTAEEKTAKQAELDQAKSTADSAIDAATDNAGVDTALTNGQSAISGIDTSTSAKKEQAKEDLETAYNAKKDEIAKSALTAEEKAVKQAELDKAKEDAENAIVTATDNAGVDTALTNGQSAISGIDTSTSAKKAQAKEDLEAAYNAKKAEIENSALTDEEKAAKQAELDQAKSTADSAIDAATDNAGVAKALEDGKTAIAGIDTSTSAKKDQAKEELKAAADDAKKAIEANDNLTPEEKAAATKAVDDEVAQANDAINAATKADEVEAATLAGEKAVAKEDLEIAYNAKKNEIANSALTAEEKAAKQAELDQAKSAADRAIDAATDYAGVAKALEDGKSAIDAINTTTSAEKAAAKQALEKAYNAKKEEIAKSSLTAEEKSAKQAELDQAKSAADSAIDVATDNTGVAKALEAGKVAIDAINTSTSAGIDTSTSAKKAQAKKDLEAAYNAKKAEIENSALTADEKAAKQAELDKAKADADKSIDAATDASGVAKALEDGKSAIDAINTTTSAEKAAAKKDLEDAYNAKKAEIENSALTADEKAAKQAELDKVKADADRAIDAATDDAGVAKALEDGKAAIDAINTTTSAGIDTSSSAKKAHKENKVLPKTGDNVGLSSVLGIAGLALLGTAIRKKRED
ncbi:YSIRK signal domain/LPXTG anchor domain surface protein [Streptococcus suis]|uniref:Putative extracellular matrix binding protein Epf n=1 Tax=Streptococcus suis TaxID=1307 RepID=A0A116P0A8_STRSU|nr:YSIRK signal domain/LPXTG anchor domain surface protein [Streptococcus suis]CYW31179.1 putative extracellular matrix binding protein Epf [Streptococcus suis]